MAVEQGARPTMPPDQQWPAIPVAYEWARPSYEIMLKRFEIHENRVRGLITMAASLTFGAPVFAKAARGDMSYDSGWLLAALGCAVFILILGTAAFIGRRVEVADPALLHATALDDAECRRPWDFQHWMLGRAAEAFHANNRALEWKGRASDAIGVVLLLELFFMGAWITLS